MRQLAGAPGTSSEPEAMRAEPRLAPPQRPSFFERLRGGSHLAAVSWGLSARSLAIVANLLLGMVLARCLTQDDFGRFELIVSIVMFGGIIASFGLNEAVFRLLSEALALGALGRARSVLRSAWPAALIGAAICLAVVPGVVWRFHDTLNPSPTLMAMVAIGGVCLGWLLITSMTLQAVENHKWAHLFGSGQQVGGFFLVVLLLVLAGLHAADAISLGHVLTAYFASLAGTALLALGLTWHSTRRCLNTNAPAAPSAAPEAANEATRRDLLGLAFPLAAIQLLAMGAFFAETWLTAAYTDAAALTLFVVGRRVVMLVNLPLQFSELSLRHVIPRMYVRGERAALQSLLQKTTFYSGVCSAIAIVGLALAGERLLTLMYGEAYAAAYWVLVILAVGQLVFVLTGVCAQVLIFTGHHRVVLWIEAAGLAAVLATAPFAALHYGIVGVAVVSAACQAAKNLGFWLGARYVAGIWTHPRLS